VLQNTILTYSEEAELRGIERGIERGRAEGIERGKAEMAREMAKNLLANGVSLDIVAKSAGLPLKKIRTLIN
jgi:predicted transposase/invertase (TIGR01784 family)